MKKDLFIIGVFFVLAIFFAGCKKDDNSSSSQVLQGRWNFMTFSREYYLEGEQQFPRWVPHDRLYMVFKGDSVKYYSSDNKLVKTASYTLVANTLSTTSSESTTSTSIKWINADQFSISEREDVSIPKNEYYINISTYIRHK